MANILKQRHITTPVLIFLIGLVATLIGLQFQVVKNLFHIIAGAGYLGALLGGVMYSSTVTSSSATVIFADMPAHLNPYLIAIVSSIGAAIYDLIIFTLFRSEEKHGSLESAFKKLGHESQIIRWIMATLAFVIIASPLPDELSAGLVSLTNLKAWQFTIMSFFANAFGVLIIVLVSH